MRFTKFTMIALVSTGLAACQATGSNSKGDADKVTYAPVSSEAFNGGVVGKTLYYKGTNNLVISENGTWSGNFGGKNIGGDWVWEDNAFCRTMAGKPRDCQIFAMSSKYDSVQVTRDRGKGASFIYTFSK